MSDKSKLPDLNELGSIASKLFKDLKTSVTEIVHDYKEKRENASESGEKPTQEDTDKQDDKKE